MKHIITIIMLTAILVSSCNQSDKKADKEKEEQPALTPDTVIKIDKTSPTEGELAFLRDYAGKYPNDVKLLDNSILNPRLKKLLGGRFTFFKETWAVESPMEIRNDLFIASACQAHNCASTNFIIVADLSKNILYAGVREEEKVKVYSEDGSSNTEVENWVKGN